MQNQSTDPALGPPSPVSEFETLSVNAVGNKRDFDRMGICTTWMQIPAQRREDVTCPCYFISSKSKAPHEADIGGESEGEMHNLISPDGGGGPQ